MAPRFGDHAGDGPLPSGRDEGSPWTSSFTGQNASGSGASKSGFSRVIRKIVPLLVTVAIAIFFFRFFFAGGGFSFGGPIGWAVLLFFGIPFIKQVVRLFRGFRDD